MQARAFVIAWSLCLGTVYRFGVNEYELARTRKPTTEIAEGTTVIQVANFFFVVEKEKRHINQV